MFNELEMIIDGKNVVIEKKEGSERFEIHIDDETVGIIEYEAGQGIVCSSINGINMIHFDE